MGRAAVYDLARAEGVEQVGLYDFDADLAEEVAGKYGNGKTEAGKIDASDENAVTKVLHDYDACLSCVTYKYNPAMTRAAIATRTHFFDLGGNNDAVREQFGMSALAKNAGVVVIPDCGLAPGMVSVLAADAVAKLDKIDSLKIRVGGLPQNPKPPLNYQMVFSSEGLINEYWEPVVILENGESKTVDPMSAIEELDFEGIGKLEAFYTSGGTSTLPETYRGKIGFLDYKTIRYPGHCDIFRPILELGFASRKELRIDNANVRPRRVLKKLLEKNLTFNEPDLVLVRLTAEGETGGKKKRLVYEIIDRQDETTGLTAMMRTTAFPAAIIAWMACAGHIDKRGVVPQELAVEPGFFIDQLRKRKIDLRIREE